MKRIAAIDFGKARIGLALTDPMRVLASPLTTIASKGNAQEDIAAILKALAPYAPVESILLGLPLHLNGKESEMSALVRAFAEKLKEAQPLPVILWDERLTSMQTERTLKECGLSRKQRAQVSDRCSAATLLQSYIDRAPL